VVSLLTGGGGPQTYFHWMYDVLPRIALLEQAGYVRDGDSYLVPRLDQPFTHETLTMMGIDPAACVQLEGPTLLEADRMAVSEGHRSYRRVEPWIPQFLRDRLMTEQPQTGRRLYVNRRDTKIRKILNEDRLEVALASRGFESVSLASFSFAEQVRLFASADVVVAPHGAGLSNVAFCPPEASVVEFRDPAWFWPVFGDAARGVNVRYTLVDALSMVGWQRLPPRIRHMLADIDAIMDTVDENLS
jgi:capsular polysaccharide biosynthesis protein